MRRISFFDLAEKDFSDEFPRGAAATIGGFDGQHLAHRVLFKKVKDFSAKTGAASCAVVFAKPPHSSFCEISTFRQKADFFEKSGFDFLISIDNFEKICIMTGESFFSVLSENARLRYVVVGDDFRCGKGRSFGKRELAAFCGGRGIECEVLPEVSLGGVGVHSSEVRKRILSGDFAAAEKFLGGKFALDCAASFWRTDGNSLVADRKCVSQVLPPNGSYDALAKTGSNGEDGKRCVVLVAENAVRVECGFDAAKIREVYL